MPLTEQQKRQVLTALKDDSRMVPELSRSALSKRLAQAMGVKFFVVRNFVFSKRATEVWVRATRRVAVDGR